MNTTVKMNLIPHIMTTTYVANFLECMKTDIQSIWKMHPARFLQENGPDIGPEDAKDLLCITAMEAGWLEEAGKDHLAHRWMTYADVMYASFMERLEEEGLA